MIACLVYNWTLPDNNCLEVKEINSRQRKAVGLFLASCVIMENFIFTQLYVKIVFHRRKVMKKKKKSGKQINKLRYFQLCFHVCSSSAVSHMHIQTQRKGFVLATKKQGLGQLIRVTRVLRFHLRQLEEILPQNSHSHRHCFSNNHDKMDSVQSKPSF